MDEATRRHWEQIADEVIDRALESARADLLRQPPKTPPDSKQGIKLQRK
jgi:hypothetical protein